MKLQVIKPAETTSAGDAVLGDEGRRQEKAGVSENWRTGVSEKHEQTASGIFGRCSDKHLVVMKPNLSRGARDGRWLGEANDIFTMDERPRRGMRRQAGRRLFEASRVSDTEEHRGNYA